MMHIWTITAWKKNLQNDTLRRTGLRFRYDRAVPFEVKQAFSRFAIWLRKEYYFPYVLVYGSVVSLSPGPIVVWDVEIEK